MQIKKVGKNLYEIKSKETSVLLDGGIKVADKELNSPGEYEIGGVFVTAVAAGDQTIFLLEVEDLNLCFLGQLKKTLSEATLEEIENVDILFVPAGGEGTLDLKQASTIIQKIDPNMIIPIYLDNEADFLKQEGETNPRREKILKITAGQLSDDDDRQLVILE